VKENKRRKEQRGATKQTKTINKMAISTYLSITLNVHGLNSLIKRHGVAEWI